MSSSLSPLHFTVAYWCVLIAALLPLVCAALAKSRIGGGAPFDNANPRAWLARQTGWRARANAAQANGFEGLPFFIGAVLVAHQLGAHQARLDVLACGYVFFRVLYILMYVAGMATPRSIAWALAFLINIAILFAGYR